MVWENVQRLIWGSTWPTNWAPEAVFYIPQKVLSVSMWSDTDVKPGKIIWENDQRPEFYLFCGPWKVVTLNLWVNTDVNLVETLLEKLPKTGIFYLFWGPRIGSLRPSLYTCESSANEEIKQDCREFRGFFKQNSRFLTHLEAQNGQKTFLHTSKSFEWIQRICLKKTDENLYTDLFLALFRAKKARNFDPQGPFFTHTHTHQICL